jgi:hypothetical protein
MSYTILIELSDGSWQPTGEVFTGTPEGAQARVDELQIATGRCHAAQAVA